MRKISYFLLTSAVMLLFACGGKKTEQSSTDADKSTDPMALYGEIDRTSAPNTITEAEKSKGWQLLFDGTTGNGWHGYNQKGIPDCWAIEDGTLTMKSEGAQEEEQDLLTNKEYKSFALSLEYKLTKGANSGIVFQIKEDPKYRFAYETGPEFQVIDHENWHEKLEDWQINGGNYAMYPPMAKPYKALGEWNQLMLVVNGNDVTQVLNGVVTVKYTKYSDEWTKLRNSGKWSAFPDYGKYDEGHISLQNHGTKVWYRNILLKELN